MNYSVISDPLAVSVASVAGNRIVRLNQNPTNHGLYGLYEYHGSIWRYPLDPWHPWCTCASVVNLSNL